MELFCAIDLRAGRAVRLRKGDFADERGFGDPLALAARFVAEGATRLHVVDLDAARTGRPENREVVAAIVAASTVPVQVGGGVRREADVAQLVELGVDRVVMGTTALTEPAVAQASAARFPGRVVLGLDYRGSGQGALEAAVSGWTLGTGASVTEVLGVWQDAPLAAVVVTAIDRDGTGSGADLDGLSAVLDVTDHPVVASGGVGSLADLEELGAVRGARSGRAPEGVIVGTALVDGTFGVKEAIAACARSG
jgi:phosphoribosylformimino-5-aminoimidazole carboxamide ribotide isomerase